MGQGREGGEIVRGVRVRPGSGGDGGGVKERGGDDREIRDPQSEIESHPPSEQQEGRGEEKRE